LLNASLFDLGDKDNYVETTSADSVIALSSQRIQLYLNLKHETIVRGRLPSFMGRFKPQCYCTSLLNRPAIVTTIITTMGNSLAIHRGVLIQSFYRFI